MFQHTAARRRLLIKFELNTFKDTVSTHSRPKAAARQILKMNFCLVVSTHSRPKAAACTDFQAIHSFFVFQHTAARRRLLDKFPSQSNSSNMFQHTAARRRLLPTYKSKKNQCIKHCISLTDFMIRSLVSITVASPLYK